MFAAGRGTSDEGRGGPRVAIAHGKARTEQREKVRATKDQGGKGRTLLMIALPRIPHLGARRVPARAHGWPGLSQSFLFDSIRPRPMLEYFELSFGGVLSLSEWWFWETMCATAGRLGIVPLCVHTIAYQLVHILFMVPLGLSIGLSVRMGTVLAKEDAEKAKMLAMWCVGFATALGALSSLSLYFMQKPIVALFTTDIDVMEGCDKIWHKIALHVFLLNIFGINGGIIWALGLHWRMVGAIFVVLWCGALPAVYHVAVIRGGGLEAIWTLLPIAYTALNVALCLCYVFADWRAISGDIKERTRRSLVDCDAPPTVGTYLLNEEKRLAASVEINP